MNLNNLTETERAIVIDALKLLEKKCRQDVADETRRSDMSFSNIARLQKQEKTVKAVTEKVMGVGYFA